MLFDFCMGGWVERSETHQSALFGEETRPTNPRSRLIGRLVDAELHAAVGRWSIDPGEGVWPGGVDLQVDTDSKVRRCCSTGTTIIAVKTTVYG